MMEPILKGRSAVLMDENYVAYKGPKATEQYKLLRDLDYAGLPIPRYRRFPDDLLVVERVPGYTLRTLRRYGLQNNAEEAATLYRLGQEAGEKSLIVKGLSDKHLIYDGEQWFIVGGSYVQGVTLKRSRKFWKEMCKF